MVLKRSFKLARPPEKLVAFELTGSLPFHFDANLIPEKIPNLRRLKIWSHEASPQARLVDTFNIFHYSPAFGNWWDSGTLTDIDVNIVEIHGSVVSSHIIISGFNESTVEVATFESITNQTISVLLSKHASILNQNPAIFLRVVRGMQQWMMRYSEMILKI